MRRVMMTKHRHSSHSDIDLYDDVEKIKAALTDAAYDVRGKAGEIFSDSLNNVKEQSTAIKEGVSDYAATKPFKALGIALLTGITLGFLLRR